MTRVHGDDRDAAGEIVGRDSFNEHIYRKDVVPERVIGKDSFGEPITNHDVYRSPNR
ncbi:hypothetical protein [Bradyrhizobium sp. SZCCHNS3053]|uniref:hypothetical protein n=1 Tax=Bradyrhizobium sp. SZCCHNS3053 TaxID=3057322 RepID=UPI0029164155|nr:hypothetical protein [Bradyrhizobium sp. SZCCHNS3053]